MHHSLLEVALVASLFGEMDYHIGFFETLKPTRARKFPQELNGLEAAIEYANTQMRRLELHHLRYYEGDRLKGAFQFKGAELIALRNSSISEAVKMRDWAQPQRELYPQRDSVIKLLRSGGLWL